MIAPKTIRRLTFYHHILNGLLLQGEEIVSSSQIAELMHIDTSQVRKDIAVCKISGKTKIGYPVKTLKTAIEKLLGFSERKDTFIVGAGNLGAALANCDEFADYGIDILAMFDNNVKKTGTKINGKQVFDIEKLDNLV